MLRSFVLPFVLAMYAVDGSNGGSKNSKPQDAILTDAILTDASAILEKYKVPTGGSGKVSIDSKKFQEYFLKHQGATTGDFLVDVCGISEPTTKEREEVRDLIRSIHSAIKEGKYLPEFPSFVIWRGSGNGLIARDKVSTMQEAQVLVAQHQSKKGKRSK